MRVVYLMRAAIAATPARCPADGWCLSRGAGSGKAPEPGMRAHAPINRRGRGVARTAMQEKGKSPPPRVAHASLPCWPWWGSAMGNARLEKLQN